MTNTRITKKDRFNQLLNIAEVKADPELVAFIEHEKELLARKNASTGERKPTKNQIANEGIKSEILDLMQSGTSYLISDMMKMFPTLADYPSQKIVALVRQLVQSGAVTREVIKGKAYFTKA